MKRIVLFLMLSVCAMAAKSQTNVLISDSTFSSPDTGKTFQYYSSEDYAYNTGCLDSIFHKRYIDPVTQSPIEVRNLYTYNPDGTVQTDIYQVYDSVQGQFTNSTRSNYTYNSQKLIATFYLDTWSDTAWVPLRYSTRAYDSKGNITNRTIQNWNPELNMYVNVSRLLYTYNAGGQLTSFETQSWNPETSDWLPGSRNLNTYDANGFLIAASDANWNAATSMWTLLDTSTFYNSAAGVLDSTLKTYPNDNSYYKFYYTYYIPTQRLYQSSSFYYVNNVLVNGDRFTNFYDSTALTHKDSSVYDMLFLPDSIYIPQIISGSEQTYNADSTLQENISYAYYISTPEANNYLRTEYYYAPCSSALPITLVNFTGELKDKDAVLHWTTKNEINAAYFNVQRSTDGIHFSDIGKVNAAGNSSVEKSYAFTDAAVYLLSVQKVYYRLVQTDKDGRTTYTNIVSLELVGKKLSIVLSPNPVRNELTIYSPLNLPNAIIRIMDMNGRLVYTSHQNLTTGSKVVVDVTSFTKGMYLVTVQSAADKYQIKIVK